MNATTTNLDPGLTADDYRKFFRLSLPPSLVLLPLGQLKEMITESAEVNVTNHFLAPTEAEHYRTFRYQKRKIEIDMLMVNVLKDMNMERLDNLVVYPFLDLLQFSMNYIRYL